MNRSRRGFLGFFVEVMCFLGFGQEGVVVPPPPHHPGGGWVDLGGQNQNFTEVVLYISALTGCSVHDLKNVLRNVLRITYIYLYPPPLPLVGGWF